MTRHYRSRGCLENLDIDLNAASYEELANVPMIGPEHARALVDHRPFTDWNDLKQLPGFSSGMVDDLRGAGARLGSVSSIRWLQKAA